MGGRGVGCLSRGGLPLTCRRSKGSRRGNSRPGAGDRRHNLGKGWEEEEEEEEDSRSRCGTSNMGGMCHGHRVGGRLFPLSITWVGRRPWACSRRGAGVREEEEGEEE